MSSPTPKHESLPCMKLSGSSQPSSLWECIPRAEVKDFPEFFEVEGSVLYNPGKEGHFESKVWH